MSRIDAAIERGLKSRSKKSAERAIANERRLWSELVTHDDGTPAVWEDLVRRSAPHVTREFFFPYWAADSAFTPSAMPGFFGLPAELEDAWQAYKSRWQRFLELNPRAMIASKLTDVSESHDASSFPVGWEHLIRDWVRSGFPDPRPFGEGNHIDSAAWRQEFADAVAEAGEAGEGWVFYIDDRYNWLTETPQ